LKSHIVRKHKSVEKPVDKINENVVEINENVVEINENVVEINENVVEINENVVEINENVGEKIMSLQCQKCQKILANKQNLKYHENICKGVQNSLECHKCHKVFTNRDAKSRHLKSCNETSLIPHNESNKPSVINNTINNSGTINSNSNNNITNNITIIAFKPEDANNLEFITNHITNLQLKAILALSKNSDNGDSDMVESYMRLVLSNPENRCIKKTNMRSIHSKVHVGNNEWQTKHDKEIYPTLVCNVANGFDKLLKQRCEYDSKILDKRTIKQIEKVLDYMSDKGYCNDVEFEKIMHQTFHELVHRVKSAVYDNTE
jgi:hypothetical protein